MSVCPWGCGKEHYSGAELFYCLADRLGIHDYIPGVPMEQKPFDAKAIEPTPFLNNEQPAPKEGRIPVYHRALADIQERVRGGRIKYGTELKTGNGRDPLVDALQEAIDLVLYLEQAILEREGY